MNTDLPPSEGDLVIALAKRLEEILGSVAWLKEWQVEHEPKLGNDRFDLGVLLSLPKGVTAELLIECKAEPRPSTFAAVAAKNRFRENGNRHTKIFVFAAPYISPRMAEVCWSHGWSWFDLAGNCRISIPDAIYVEVTGKETNHSLPPPSANLSTHETARVLRVILAPKWLGKTWTQRELQQECSPTVSLGLVNKVIRYLRDQSFVEQKGDEGFGLRDPMGLLKAWNEVYQSSPNWRKTYFTLGSGRKLQEILAPLAKITGGKAAYAVFSAGEFQAPHVRQPKTWLFLGSQFEQEIAKLSMIKEVDSGENILVYFPKDDGVFYDLDHSHPGHLPCTNLIQTYLDLSHFGGRGPEAAEALLEQQLKPLWKTHGLIPEKP